MHHLFMDVDGLAVTPRFERALREGDHYLAVGGYPSAMKCRLGKPPLTSPELALAGQEPLAQQAPVSLEDPRLSEVAIVLDEDVLDQAWIRKQVYPLAHEAQLYDSPYSRTQRERKPKGSLAYSRTLPPRRCPLGPGGACKVPIILSLSRPSASFF